MINGPAPARAVVVPLSPARARLLDHLEEQSEPVTAAQVSRALGIHPNGARLHLDGLVAAGLAIRGRGAAGGRGRPPSTYRVDPAAAVNPRVRDYAQLAGALAAVIADSSPDPRGEARLAGADWGARLVAGATADTPRRARRRVVEMLADLGFDPRANSQATEIALRKCPLLEAARLHTDVVCQVHLGLVRGAMHELGHDAAGSQLVPFAEPGACRLYLDGARGAATGPDAPSGR